MNKSDFSELADALNERNGDLDEYMGTVALIPYDALVEFVEDYLIENGHLPKESVIVDIDLALPVNDEGEVEFDIEFIPGGVKN